MNGSQVNGRNVKVMFTDHWNRIPTQHLCQATPQGKAMSFLLPTLPLQNRIKRAETGCQVFAPLSWGTLKPALHCHCAGEGPSAAARALHGWHRHAELRSGRSTAKLLVQHCSPASLRWEGAEQIRQRAGVSNFKLKAHQSAFPGCEAHLPYPALISTSFIIIPRFNVMNKASRLI